MSRREIGFDFSDSACIIWPDGIFRDGRRGRLVELMEKAVETTFLL
jgi:hypothetical protein